MTIQHKIWHADAESVCEVQGCQKFIYESKMADGRHLGN